MSFQVDLKENRLRSTKPVVEVTKIDSTRHGILKSTLVDSNRPIPRSTRDATHSTVMPQYVVCLSDSPASVTFRYRDHV